jgi:nitroreductase
VTTDVFEVMRTCRAMRHYETRDVPDEIIIELLDLAIRAPSGGNAQNWAFIVVRDPAVKRALGEEIRRGTRWKTVVDEQRIAAGVRAGIVSTEEEARAHRNLRSFNDLGEHFADIPVVVCVCMERDQSTGHASGSSKALRSAVAEFGLWGALRFALAAKKITTQARWAAGYPAVQNLLLAARAKGLGAVLTTPHFLGPPGRIEKILGLPRHVGLAAVVPLGYPKGRFGPVRRLPPKAFRDRYGG